MVQMLVGLLIGLVLGLLVGPVLRSWLAWREYTEASREAQLTDDVLRVMSRSTGDDDSAKDAAESLTG
jgi:uncharacterized protein YneF (UPF0154 family)